MIRIIASLALAGVLAACASKEEAKPPDMALACQTMTCQCTETKAAFLRSSKTTPILWRKNGDAYCPKGFGLERSKEQ